MDKILLMSDKINTYPNFIYMINIILSIDLYLILHVGGMKNVSNIRELSLENISVGAALELIFFCLCLNFVIMCIWGIIKWLIIQTGIRKSPDRRLRWKCTQDLYDEAIREESSFKYACYHEAQKRRIENQSFNKNIFEFILLVVCDLFLSEKADSIVCNLVNSVSISVDLLLLGIFFLLIRICLNDLFDQNDSMLWPQQKPKDIDCK